VVAPTVPTLAEAERYLDDAQRRNPGPWVAHSRYVADAARLLAQQLPQIDPDRAVIFGLLHDIGRREGITHMRHIIDGHRFMVGEGFPAVARICVTHSFAVQEIGAASGTWDCTPAEYAFVADYLASITYDDYDRLFQLCDALALPTGFCLLEKRFVDVVLRYGFNSLTVEKWRATLAIKRAFEGQIGRSIYDLLPGVAATSMAVDVG
jgi:HD domain